MKNKDNDDLVQLSVRFKQSVLNELFVVSQGHTMGFASKQDLVRIAVEEFIAKKKMLKNDTNNRSK